MTNFKLVEDLNTQEVGKCVDFRGNRIVRDFGYKGLILERC